MDKRTVKRYIKFMKEKLYLPVEYDSHKKGFFYTNTKRTLKNFFEENSDYSITNSDESDESDESDFSLRAKTGNEVASVLRNNGLLCFESPEVAELVNNFRSNFK